MTVLTRLVVLLAALAHISCVLCIPVPFGEVEKAWKQGLSEVSPPLHLLSPPTHPPKLTPPLNHQRDIHASALATPSFFHEARSDAARPQPHVRAYMQQAFDSALDERSLAAAAAAVAKRGSANVVRRGLDLVASVQGFMDRKVVEWMMQGEGEGEDGDDAPVIRPRGGRRWNF